MHDTNWRFPRIEMIRRRLRVVSNRHFIGSRHNEEGTGKLKGVPRIFRLGFQTVARRRRPALPALQHRLHLCVAESGMTKIRVSDIRRSPRLRPHGGHFLRYSAVHQFGADF
jgi:hypothetical protein